MVDSSGSETRTMTKVTCSACKKETEVPFKPTSGRPVYCKTCFAQKRASGGPGGGGGGGRGGPRRGGGRDSGPRQRTSWARSEYVGYNPDVHAPDRR